ncbi:OmpA family protein [Flagellimonas meishanensis]|uniref:OmpA family protein n=1 Tax=Flagellimonas meishanensis TaxID=2873264 RepID=UPI001CA75214|nr:OmpA family protein [[Muricauda] meishanensis]
MKTSSLIKIFLSIIFMFGFGLSANAQFLKKLAKKAEKAAERTVERRVERETSEKTDQALDSILEPGSGGKNKAPGTGGSDSPSSGGKSDQGNDSSSSKTDNSSGEKSIEVYSKFDFVPGDEVIFFDDFSNDFVGDFPSKWDTNSGGEIVTVGNSPEKWLELIPGWNTYYLPNITSLPEDYTIEFDILTAGLDDKTSSQAGFHIMLSDDPKFKDGSHYTEVWLPVGQYGSFDIRAKNYKQGKGSEINSAVRSDIRKAILNRPHISIAVNGQRYRLWVNESKYVDIPRFIPEGSDLKSIKFNVNGLKDGKDRVFISNLKVAKGGVDLRRKLLSEGSVSTNGILFDSGSANIQPQSMGIILQISQVLKQETSMNLNIVGHTDADGSDEANLKLSKSRAEAVKKVLVDVYRIGSDRLQTDGKGESEPVADNNTPAGKAKNRRVVFKRI